MPVGAIVMWDGFVADIPVTWALCNGLNGTPDLRGMFIKGALAGAEPGLTGGAASHLHTVTQPGDHAALSHAGATVGDHTVTQPGAHSAHVVTQPGAHSNHVVTQPSAHADNIAHTHGLQGTGGTTLSTTGAFLATSSASGGSLRTATGPSLSQGTGSSLVHSGAAVDAHSAHSGTAVDAHSAHSGTAVSVHSVGQASQHAAMSHTGAAVNSVSNEPAYYSLAYIKRVA